MFSDLKGKKVLLIGSGADLTGRAMQERIESGAEWAAVVRINKHYGAPEDVGCRTDVAVMARRVWFNYYFSACPNVPRMVAFAEGIGCPKDYRATVAAELGVERVSTGLAAAHLLLDAGAQVELIGFNAPGGVPSEGGKRYADGTLDTNEAYDWAAELKWLQAQPRITFL